tara:strand:+ start:221 stop:892 length:672 start_codon:yes stop_codon:yes gene_type:complete
MSRITLIVLIIISILIFFNKKIVSYYYINKFSKWVERPVKIKKLKFDYSGNVKIEDIEISNNNKNYFKNVFKAKKIEINFDINSIFSNLIIIESLNLYDPEFFLDINIKKDYQSTDNKKIYEDNIGLAKKINENIPDKIWPKKNKDVNFLIKKSNLYGSIGYIKVPQISNPSKIKLSQMKFSSFGNDKNYRHYKDILNSILFDLYARTDEIELKQLLKEIYRF